MLDGVQIIAEEKAKSENLHGIDLKDREQIFKMMLPQENFVDRRICVFEDIEEEWKTHRQLSAQNQHRQRINCKAVRRRALFSDRRLVNLALSSKQKEI